MLETIVNYIFMFFAFSAIGWTVESTYRSIGERRVINSGFLHGPVCPIYGTGGLVFHVLLVPISLPFEKRVVLVILLGMVFADIVEYLTSYLMEKLFHARWWDYSNNFLNINGRICFKHTIYWAIFAFMYVYVIAPVYTWLCGFIPQPVRNIAVVIILVLFAFDLLVTVKDAINIGKVMNKLNELKSTLQFLGDAVVVAAENLKDTAENRYESITSVISANTEKLTDLKTDIGEQFSDIRSSFEKLISGQHEEGGSKGTKRLLLNSKLKENADSKYKELESFWNEIKNKVKNAGDKDNEKE